MKKTVRILLVTLMLHAAVAGAGVSTNKSFFLNTNNVLAPNMTNFFVVNSNLMNASVAGAGGALLYGTNTWVGTNTWILPSFFSNSVLIASNETVGGSVTVTGPVQINNVITANGFSGSGAFLSSGTVPLAAIAQGGATLNQIVAWTGSSYAPVNPPGSLVGYTNVWTGTNTFTYLFGNGFNLTNLDATNLTGVIPLSALPLAVITNNFPTTVSFGATLQVGGSAAIVGTVFGANFVGSGAGLNSLSVPLSTLSASSATVGQMATWSNTSWVASFNGGGLTNLNATNLNGTLQFGQFSGLTGSGNSGYVLSTTGSALQFVAQSGGGNVGAGSILTNVSIVQPTNNTISVSNITFLSSLTNAQGLFGVDTNGYITGNGGGITNIQGSNIVGTILANIGGVAFLTNSTFTNSTFLGTNTFKDINGAYTINMRVSTASGAMVFAPLNGTNTLDVNVGPGIVGSAGGFPIVVRTNGLDVFHVDAGGDVVFQGALSGVGSGLTGITPAGLQAISGSPNSSTYYRGDGTWSVPPGSGGGGGGTGSLAQVIQTNWLVNTYYTNTQGAPLLVSGTVTNIVAAVAGYATMELTVSNVGDAAWSVLAKTGLGSSSSAIPDTYTNTIAGTISNNAVFAWSNIVSGSGDVSGFVTGTGQQTLLAGANVYSTNIIFTWLNGGVGTNQLVGSPGYTNWQVNFQTNFYMVSVSNNLCISNPASLTNGPNWVDLYLQNTNASAIVYLSWAGNVPAILNGGSNGPVFGGGLTNGWPLYPCKGYYHVHGFILGTNWATNAVWELSNPGA